MTQLRVKQLLGERDQSINWLAKKARIDYSVAHRYANNALKSLDRTVLDKIAWALGVTVAELFEGQPEPTWDDRRTRTATTNGTVHHRAGALQHTKAAVNG